MICDKSIAKKYAFRKYAAFGLERIPKLIANQRGSNEYI